MKVREAKRYLETRHWKGPQRKRHDLEERFEEAGKGKRQGKMETDKDHRQ